MLSNYTSQSHVANTACVTCQTQAQLQGCICHPDFDTLSPIIRAAPRTNWTFLPPKLPLAYLGWPLIH
jgi:hypothetical protein